MRNKLEVDKLIAKGLYFGGYNHIVDRYWEIGPEEICPKCLEYRHISYRGCLRIPKYYIYTENYKAKNHKCLIIGYSALIGKAYIYLPIKYILQRPPFYHLQQLP